LFDRLEEDTILITGGAGFIGSNLADELIARGHKVTILDNLSSGSLKNVPTHKNLTFVKGDIRDIDLVDNLVKQSELIYHLAEFIPLTKNFGSGHVVKFSSDSPLQDLDVSTRGTLTMLDSARKYDRKFVFSSTAAVYGGSKNRLTEESPILPVSPYGVSKFCAEQYVQYYSRVYGLPTSITRFFNVYGPRQSKYIMYDLLYKVAQNPPQLEMLGTGEESRDFVYVRDVICALLLVSQDEFAKGQTYNVASGKYTKISDVVYKMLELIGFHPNVVFTGSSWKGDVKNLIADISKISSIGFEPQYNLENGLKQMISWFNLTNAG
jgi:UDP-glucose 4-epimerase